MTTTHGASRLEELERRLRESEERFELVAHGSNDGIWDWDLRTNDAYFSPRWKGMLGFEDDEIENRFEEWESRVHSDDLDRAWRTIRSHLEGETPVYELEHRLRHRDGSYRWILARGASLRDEYGVPYRLSGSHSDVTARRDAEQKLQESEGLYRTIFDAAAIGTALSDVDGRLLETNRALQRIIGYSGEELHGMEIPAFTHPEDARKQLPLFRELVAGEREVYQLEKRYIRKDGKVVWGRLTESLARDEDGTPKYAVAMVEDITERIAAEEKLREKEELLEERVDERTRELATLLDVSHNVASTLELEPLLDLILEQLRMVADYNGAALLELTDGRLVTLTRRSPGPNPQAGPTYYVVDKSRALHDVLMRGEPVIVDDVRGDAPNAVAYREAVGELLQTDFQYERAWMGIPMVAKDRVVGVLSLSSAEPGYFTPRQVELAMAIANQAAIAIENARLYEQAQRLAAVEERARLARELHDSVTQALFSMTLQTRASQMMLEREGAQRSELLARSLQQLSDLAQGALAEMRALIFELRPGALSEEGLAAALRKRSAGVSAREELRIDVEAPHDRLPLEPAVEEQLYRVAEEALHNIVKHAGASRVTVRLSAARDDAGTLVLEIEDDGAGFDASSEFPGHMGLSTMAERVHQVGGRLEITSAPGKGTTVRAVVAGAIHS